MKKSDFKKLERNQLIELLIDVSKLNKENDVFLKSKLTEDHQELFRLTCKKLDNAFSCFELMSLKEARTALNDFKKSKPSKSLLIKLYLYYIKRAYELEKTDWRFQENFYSAIEKVYDLIFNILIEDVFLKEKYLIEVEKMIKKSNEGWGHRDYLNEKLGEIR